MFGSSKKSRPNMEVETVLGRNTCFKGTITSSTGSVRIDGRYEGQVDIEGDLVIGTGAEVVADIKARNITISGNVNGNVVAGEKMEILSTGVLNGDAKGKSLVIEEGACFNGRGESIRVAATNEI